ncbi:MULTISPECIES: hypothetical protein [Gammaproteobacteria]|uniref:hypothetical protein n=1 Tax=Gammaproteobacteria TaxID=1236 RepID=UPI00186794E9|nr:MULTISPECIES: hypothetical protein [Gammaproteobacteria]
MANTSKNKAANQKKITQKKQQSLLQKNKCQQYNDPLFSSFIEETTSVKALPLTPLQRGIQLFFSLFDYATQILYVAFIITVWWLPERFSVQTIYNLTVLFLFEFILVHSGVFMAAFARTKFIFALIPIYSIFALIINSMIMGDENLIIWLYAVIIANRIISGYQVKTKEEMGKNLLYSALLVINFMLCLFSVLIFQFLVPYGGLTPQYLNEIDYLYLIPQHSDYFNVPHVGMAYGTLFYSIPLACITYINLLPIYKRMMLKIKIRNRR